MNNIVSMAAWRNAARTEDVYADLPPANTSRWVASRKAAVASAVNSGVISKDDALRRYNLSDEELTSWRESLAVHGPGGLHATRVQHYRKKDV